MFWTLTVLDMMCDLTGDFGLIAKLLIIFFDRVKKKLCQEDRWTGMFMRAGSRRAPQTASSLRALVWCGVLHVPAWL